VAKFNKNAKNRQAQRDIFTDKDVFFTRKAIVELFKAVGSIMEKQMEEDAKVDNSLHNIKVALEKLGKKAKINLKEGV
jgi:hypothetical protein